MCGWENQQTGDDGQALVTSALTRAKFLVGSLTPDPGEDLWAEVDGRKNIAEGAFPLRALLQVKATAEAVGECVLDLDVDDLRRWAAQPLPVFVVGVSTPTEAFFVKSVGDIVSEDLQGKNVFELRTRTARVRINPTHDIASTIRGGVESHYQSLKLTLAGVSEDDRKAHYFEVLSRWDPEPISLVATVGWFILWKSPARPQHFTAMISELIRLCEGEYEGHQPTPAVFHFHVYRSIEDRHHNLAIARVDVVNPRHPKRVQISQTLGIKGEYRVRHDQDVKPMRDFFRSRTVSAVDFRNYAQNLGPMLDALSDKILAQRVRRPIWNDELNGDCSVVDDLWNNGPFAPSECGPLDGVLGGYYNCLLAHRHIEVYRAHYPLQQFRDYCDQKRRSSNTLEGLGAFCSTSDVGRSSRVSLSVSVDVSIPHPRRSTAGGAVRHTVGPQVLEDRSSALNLRRRSFRAIGDGRGFRLLRFFVTMWSRSSTANSSRAMCSAGV